MHWSSELRYSQVECNCIGTIVHTMGGGLVPTSYETEIKMICTSTSSWYTIM